MWDPDIDESSEDELNVVPNPPVVVPPPIPQTSVSQSTSRPNPVTRQRSLPIPQPVLDQSYPLYINLEQKGKIPPFGFIYWIWNCTATKRESHPVWETTV